MIAREERSGNCALQADTGRMHGFLFFSCRLLDRQSFEAAPTVIMFLARMQDAFYCAPQTPWYNTTGRFLRHCYQYHLTW